MGLDCRVRLRRAYPGAIPRARKVHKPLKCLSGTAMGGFEAVCSTSRGADTPPGLVPPRGVLGVVWEGRGRPGGAFLEIAFYYHNLYTLLSHFQRMHCLICSPKLPVQRFSAHSEACDDCSWLGVYKTEFEP